MPASDDIPSSPGPGSSVEEALAYYKAQYENLESELADFQETSRALEADLERDIEASEKRERQLKEKADNLAYEVDEWKTKYKQAKNEGGSVHNKLQKEITTLRDQNRTLQLKLRDIEVANDDFERQARHTESSLEDLESKYNVAIERGVMLEEEMRTGEQEREQLRIETQRLRDELSDMKIESDIVKEKLQYAEKNLSERRSVPTLEPIVVPQSPRSERSPTTTASSPFVTTPPPTKSTSSGPSEIPTPPSPPISDNAGNAQKPFVTPSIPKPRLSVNGNTTPRPSAQSARPAGGHVRGPSIPVNGRTTPSMTYRTSLSKPSTIPRQPGLPQSTSIYQLRNLRGKMQRLEERVHSAKSRLPAPITTPPRASPRSGSALGHNIPSSVTVRSSRRGTRTSTASGATSDVHYQSQPAADDTPSLRSRPSRLSFNRPPPTPSRVESRPASRTSNVSQRNSINPYQHARPGSRQSISGVRTPLGGAPYAPNASTDRIRPKSSLSSYDGANDDIDETTTQSSIPTPTPRRSTFGRTSDIGLPSSSIPTPAALRKKQSMPPASGRRVSSGVGDMGPPRSKTPANEAGLEDVEETY